MGSDKKYPFLKKIHNLKLKHMPDIPDRVCCGCKQSCMTLTIKKGGVNIKLLHFSIISCEEKENSNCYNRLGESLMNNEWFMTLHKTYISFVWTDTIDQCQKILVRERHLFWPHVVPWFYYTFISSIMVSFVWLF